MIRTAIVRAIIVIYVMNIFSPDQTTISNSSDVYYVYMLQDRVTTFIQVLVEVTLHLPLILTLVVQEISHCIVCINLKASLRRQCWMSRCDQIH